MILLAEASTRVWRYDPRDVSEIWRDARLGDGGMKLMAVDELFRSGCLSGSQLQEFKEKELTSNPSEYARSSRLGGRISSMNPYRH